MLARGAHADAPAREAQEREEARIHQRGREHEHQARRPRCARRSRQRGVAPAQVAQRILRLRAEGEDHRAAQQDAERDGGEHRRQHRLSGHAPHQRHVHRDADHEGEDCGGGDRDQRMAAEQRCGGVQPVGAEHHQLAVRERQHPAHAVDQDIAAADERIDRGEDRDVDRDLHPSLTSIACQSCARTMRLAGVPAPDAVVLTRAGSGCPWSTRAARRAGPSCRP